MIPVGSVALSDAVVALEPLTTEHLAALWDAARERPETHGLTRVPTTAEETRVYVDLALAEGQRGAAVPFATRDVASRRVVGSTSFLNIERWTWPAAGRANQRSPEFADAVEIGATWLAPSAQRTGINTHAKLLMLTHAFEAWEVRRVTLKTDARNARSRAAIERLGARHDGTLRAHMPGFDGAVRDTAFYSILTSEWPSMKARLVAMAL